MAERNTQRFAERFELHEVLGRGGMAVVYRATDLGNGRVVALKQLIAPERDEQRGHVELLFEREFHTLSQLRHPCVIEVYDYGVTPDGVCYYTMELLDGGALRDRVPVAWREVCRLAFDVASSLALLHSRRLLHRDVSPRNVHCTRTGAAKLIDFGAVAPMTADGSLVVGTPSFTAPEVVQRSATDGRTDLFSLGATLYYALTGRLAYPARSFADLFSSWNTRPVPPSLHAPSVPPALDELVQSMLSLEPALRPPSAFAVMQQLAAIADLPSAEAEGVSRAYLATPALAGRDALLAGVRDRLVRSFATGGRGVMLRGASGIGRSRLLDACALEAKTLGARVLRANARGKPQDFEVAVALAEHLVEALPSEELALQFPQLFAPDQPGRPRLRELAQLRAQPELLERSLVLLMRAAAKAQPLVFAVDDVHRIDEPSAAVLAGLIDRFRYGRAVAVLSAESGDETDSSSALAVLARRCDQLALEPLSRDDTRRLLGSVFGDVPNLDRLNEELFELARGNPRETLDLAQHLIDRGLIEYAAGTWTLPRALAERDLPRSAEAAIRARLEQLTPLARFLAQAHSLAFLERLTHEDFRALAPGSDARAVDAAVSELLAQQAIAGDGTSYVIANRLWAKALQDAPEAERAHLALAALFDKRFLYGWHYHALMSGGPDVERAIDSVLEDHARLRDQEHLQALEHDVNKLAATFVRAVELAQRLGRPARQLYDLQHGRMATAVATATPEDYWAVAPRLLGQLVHDTGLDLYRLDKDNPDAGARLSAAFTQAFERYNALPERERVYRPDEAIAQLAEYVVFSIAISARTFDVPLMRSLPELLEPFAPLSPLVSALWNNAISAWECLEFCRYESARARWIEVHLKLGEATGQDVRYVTAIRNAIAYAVGTLEAQFGLPTAARWADDLDHDPYQRVSALYLRKIVRLEQGDWTGAERLQRSAELLALRARLPQMFSSTLTVEISAHALARDLAGVQDVIQRERAEAARFPGWTPYLREAEARFELIRGDFASAKTLFEALIASTAPDENLRTLSMPSWVAAQSGLVEALLGLERAEEARSVAVAALAICDALKIQTFAYDIVRVLALAEAKLGAIPEAVARLDGLIAAQTALGAGGLRIGITYEARAEVALWSGDAPAFEKYAQLTAREYRYGARCPLSARYERLTREARRRGMQVAVAPSDFGHTTALESDFASLSELRDAVRGALIEGDRFRSALRLLCGARAARGGHLYLPGPLGPQLAATHDLPAPAQRLTAQVREYLEQQEDYFDTQTIAVVGPPAADTNAPTAHVDGVDYELLLLVHSHQQIAQITGVIALAPGNPGTPYPRQALLLASIAEQLSASASPQTMIG